MINLDKLYSKCCKIFKGYLTVCRVNFALTHFSYLAAKLLLLIFLNALLKTKFVVQVFIMRKTVYWFTEKIKRLVSMWWIYANYNCAIDSEWIMNRHWQRDTNNFWDFLPIILRIFGWLSLDFFLLNRLFVKVIKIINLTILKLYPAKLTIIIFNEVAFYFIWLLCRKRC